MKGQSRRISMKSGKLITHLCLFYSNSVQLIKMTRVALLLCLTILVALTEGNKLDLKL